MIFQANDNQKMAKVDIFTAGRIDFKLKMVKEAGKPLYNDKEGQFIKNTTLSKIKIKKNI